MHMRAGTHAGSSECTPFLDAAQGAPRKVPVNNEPTGNISLCRLAETQPDPLVAAKVTTDGLS